MSLTRITFALRHLTLKRVALDPADPEKILVCGRRAVLRLARRCPHQGADLMMSPCSDSHLICHWHGCRFGIEDGKFEKGNIDMRGDTVEFS
ncbi:Rieske 2Fe-2S domain-containing protein [bacterium]|nr:Rieske 2Fe-2S domain-containing protein [bacterium]